MELITDFLLKLETWGSVFVVKGPICNITYLLLGLVIEQVNPFYLLISLLPLILVLLMLVKVLLLSL